MELSILTINDIEAIKVFFKSVFTKEPWNDDWSDENQLHLYIGELIGNPNSLTLGAFEDGSMLGVSMGYVKHWFAGTEYCIDEFCIRTDLQGRGLGTAVLKSIEEYLSQKNIHTIYLETERTVKAYDFYRKNGFIELSEHISLSKDF